MPYNARDMEIYNKGYYAGYRKATIDHLGGKCAECGETDSMKLDIHHRNGLDKHARNLKDIANLKDLQLLCKNHHDQNTYGASNNK
jgi:5-methylcytosine-specific restriction endonuclease McrA